MIIKTGNCYGQTPLTPPAGGNAAASALGDTTLAATDNSGGTTVQLQRTTPGFSTAPANAAKLAEVKQAISEGRLQVNTNTVASGLIQSVVDLLAAQ